LRTEASIQVRKRLPCMSPSLPDSLPMLYFYHVTVQYFSTSIAFIAYRSMFDEKRRITSIVYLSCLGSTMVVVFLPLPGSLKLITLLLLTITQFSASVWYSLSYVPYGRRTLLRFAKNRLGLEESDYSGVTLSSVG
jgi:predicted membrane channel-forming protein YqfA (hemolysin III family)